MLMVGGGEWPIADRQQVEGHEHEGRSPHLDGCTQAMEVAAAWRILYDHLAIEDG
jgi:hypothetical protein